MNKRLVWNFEIDCKKPLQLPSVNTTDESSERWECRYFWPDDKIITLHGLNDHFMALSHYQSKHRQDTYYLLPEANYNLKMRRDELFYKPVLNTKTNALAYGKKIKLAEQPPGIELAGCEENDGPALIARIKKQGIKINVEKEALIYKFETSTTAKLELAWLQVANKSFFSVSIESRSLLLVESISSQLLGGLPTCDYVTFLRGILT